MTEKEFKDSILGIIVHQDENSLLQVIAEYTATNSFTDGKSDTPDLQDAGLGIAIAQWARWDGIRVLRVAFSALQDANFHHEAAQVDQMLKALYEEDNSDRG